MEKTKTKTKTAIAKFIDQFPKAGDAVPSNLNKEDKAVNDRIGETLIFELPSGKKVKFIAKLVDPKKCKVWKGNIRIQEFLTEKNTCDLRGKIKAQGQLVPVLARPIKNDSKYSHEIIYGSRRHFVCSSMDIGIKILEADLDDADALTFMDAENSGREDMSPYETALAYKFWMDEGIFKNQGELSQKLGITRSWLNKIISLVRIPKEIILAIDDPKVLSLKKGLELVQYLSKDPERLPVLIKRSTDMKTNGMTPEYILSNLFEGGLKNINERTSVKTNEVKVILSDDGKTICKIFKPKNNNLVIKFANKTPGVKVSSLINDIENLISSKLKEETS